MTVRTRQVAGHTANGAPAVAERSPQFSWEDWFRHASTQQRADALGLARQQGLLYPYQVSAVSNGVKPAAPPAPRETATSQLVARLLAGKTETLLRLPAAELTYADPDLDALQRQAVARAMATPDLFLLQGLPGTGKSRVLLEILHQATARGWRVLFLAGQTASLDVLLQRLIGRTDIVALRFLDAQEKPASLPAWLRTFTPEAQQQAFLDRMVTGARGNQAQAESVCRARHDQAPWWEELHAAAARRGALDDRLRNAQEELPRLADAVECEAVSGPVDSPVRSRLADLTQAHQGEMTAIEAALDTQQATLARSELEITELSAQIALHEPAYLAKKQRRFWTLRFWLNLFNGSIIPEMEALLEKHAIAAATKQEAAQQLDQIAERRQRRGEKFAQERAALLSGEVQARRQALEIRQRQLREELAKLDADWTALCQRLGVTPASQTSEAIAEAELTWQQQKKRDEQQCQFAQQWTAFVEGTGAVLAARLPSFANVFCGTLMRWHTDAKFREAVGAPVDLVVIEDAETLTEADLAKLARHGQRCVLVGQALAEPTPAPTIAEKASRALLPAPLVSAVCWSKLWQALGGNAESWPCSWRREQGRLICQLMPLAVDDVRHLESEGLADAPDIELRILHRPNTQPCLAQVIFAPQRTFADAFRFMVNEVQEFPLHPAGRTAWWHEDARRHCRQFGAAAARVREWIELEPGLRLGTVSDEFGDAVRIGCIEFDKAAAWDRARADAWLYRQRPVHDHERTVFLQTPYRFPAALARIVETTIRPGEWLSAVADGPDELSPHAAEQFEFIAVPPLAKQDWPREGAGLELDLSAVRHADRLPVGLRHGLPNRGFVNYLEAQALIRRLEAWQLKESSPTTQVAVLALYEGQVDLLRRLVEQSEILRARTYPLEVALPSKLHQRECDVVFLSLTRSHAHRSTAFGDDVKELPLALTRPRSRLLVFGDAGALRKRAGWTGPVDQLDGSAAHQELSRVSRLLAYLQQHTPVTATANGQANGRGSL